MSKKIFQKKSAKNADQIKNHPYFWRPNFEPMANVSTLVRASSGKKTTANVMFRLFDGKDVKVFYTSDIIVELSHWDNTLQCIKSKIRLMDENEKIRINREVDEMRNLILKIYKEREWGTKATSAWLKDQIEYELNGNHSQPEQTRTFFELFEEFLDVHRVSQVRKNNYMVVLRSLRRFEMFQRHHNRRYELNLTRMTSNDLRLYEKFLRNEHEYYKTYPTLYKDVPEKRAPKKRGDNTVSGIFTKLRTFVSWALKKDKSFNDPFENFENVNTKYGSPIYLTVEERNKIYKYDFSQNPKMELQRDIFIFQCVVGCRIGDFYKLKKDSLINGSVHYIQEKTKEGNPRTIRVPLIPIGQEIFEKYKDIEEDRLFPFMSQQKYNKYIKKIFKEVGINRMVTRLNPTTNTDERLPICDIASSHMARKTFIGNVYKYSPDQKLVSILSGHKENSTAFNRYANVDDEMMAEVMQKII